VMVRSALLVLIGLVLNSDGGRNDLSKLRWAVAAFFIFIYFLLQLQTVYWLENLLGDFLHISLPVITQQKLKHSYCPKRDGNKNSPAGWWMCRSFVPMKK
jgi:hypothetical protein